MTPIECTLTELVAEPSLSIRMSVDQGHLASEMAKGYREIRDYLKTIDHVPSGPSFAIYYNVDNRHLDVEFGFPTASVLKGMGRIRPSQTPSGKAATCVHIGSHNHIEHTYLALTKWIVEHGYEVSGLVYEVLLSDPDCTPSEQLQTRVYQVLKTAV
jgi:effector-binding domain-containing protein